MARLYTIGHSNHPLEGFLALLHRHGIEVLVDVRAVPYSRRFPHFRKPALEAALAEAGIAYRWRGDSLGGIARRSDVASFAEAAARPHFQAALDELEALAATARTAIMCAEREPMDCHRTALVGRHLRGRDLEIAHIHADGTLESNADFEHRLIAATGSAAPLLDEDNDAVEAAYDALATKMARGRR